jgi:hypothetical protein
MRRSRAGSAYLARRPGWWSVPAGLAGVVLRRRTMVPGPRTYLLAAAAGAVLGAAAQLAFGWPWWLVAAGVVAAVALGFLATGFRGGGAGRPLATEVLLVVDRPGGCGGSARPWSSGSGPPRSRCTACPPPGRGRGTWPGRGAARPGASGRW